MDSRELAAQFASQSCTRTIFEKNINSVIPEALHQILIGAQLVITHMTCQIETCFCQKFDAYF